jgi:hypothetical protein
VWSLGEEEEEEEEEEVLSLLSGVVFFRFPFSFCGVHL